MKKIKGLINYKTATWGTYGPTGKGPLKYVRLIDCSTEHLTKIQEQNAAFEAMTGLVHPYSKFIKKILNKRHE